MKLATLVLLSAPAWALSNAVTIQEKSGSTQLNRVVTIPRYFANQEICLNPRPYSGGSAVTYWQVNVKTRWPADSGCAGGYARFALITVEIPSLAGNGTYVVEFRSDAASSSSGSGLTQQQMLDFDAGGGVASWGFRITTVAGGTLTDSISARDMIGNGHYQVLESGPLRTSVLVREGPDSVNSVLTRDTSFGYQCTAGCTAPYAAATWVHHPNFNGIRPSFEITFFSPSTGTGRIEEGGILDNAWLDRYQDQRLSSFVIYNGGAETTACYTAPVAFVFPAGTRLYETCNEATPGAVNIDFNLAYVTYTKVLLAYSLDMLTGASATALEVADFNATDQGTTVAAAGTELGFGQMIKGSAAGGSSPILGWMPRWSTHYPTSGFAYTMLAVILGNAKANMHAPYTFLENRTTTVYHSGDTEKAFGRIVSIDARTRWASTSSAGTNNPDAPTAPKSTSTTGTIIATSCLAPTTPTSGGCMVTCLSSMYWCSRYASGGTTWSFDNAHSDNSFFLPYLFTGKRVYLEGLWTVASMHVAYEPANDPPLDWAGRWGSRGIILDPYQNPRGSTWPLRNFGQAALLSDDGSVEKTFWTEKLNNNLEMHEGRQNIIDGNFAPTNPAWLGTTPCAGFSSTTEQSIWRMGRCFYDSGWTNPLHIPARHFFIPSYSCPGCDLSLAGDTGSTWTEVYWLETHASLRDWGFKASALHTAASKYFIHMFSDPARTDGNPALSFLQWQPNLQSGDAGYIQTWAGMKAPMLMSTPLSKDIDNSTATIPLRDYTPDADNNLDIGTKAATYYKIGNEIVFDLSGAYILIQIASVDAALDRVTTTTAHGFINGQMVRIRAATTVDPGMVGSTCKIRYVGGPRNDNCDFWVKAIDTTHLEFYTDASLTAKVNLVGGGSWYVHNSTLTVTRGVLGTTAAAHTRGDTVFWYPSQIGTWDDSNPSGGHGYYYIGGLATAVDYDISDIAEGNGVSKPLAGQTLTARRAFDIVSQVVRRQNQQGASVANCGAVGLNVSNCDNSQWSIRPRPTIRNVRVVPNTTSAKFYYAPLDGYTCKVGTSTTPYTSTDDSGDTSDAQTNPSRSTTVSSLSSGTLYYYRITCGPAGGAARVSGTFTTP